MRELKMTEVWPRLFVRGHTLRLKTEEALHGLRAKDVRLVVNVSTREDGPLKHACETIGISYLYQPLSDGQIINEPLVMALGDRVAEAIKDYGVLVHCRAGANRSGLVASLAVRKAAGVSGSVAVARVRMLRQRAVVNPHFYAFMCGLEAPK